MLHTLFGFNGRINRSQYWIGVLASALLGFVAIIGIMAMSAGSLMLISTDPVAGLSGLAGASLLLIPLFVAMIWSGLAIQVKRFHDRGRTGYLVLIPPALAVAMCISMFGQAASGAPPQAVVSSVMPFVWAIWAVNLWFFIDLGCLASVKGPNKYGDPPGTLSGGLDAGPSAPNSLGGAEAAMARAMADRDRSPAYAQAKAASGAMQQIIKPAPQTASAKFATPAPAAAYAARPAGAAPAFGRRTTRQALSSRSPSDCRCGSADRSPRARPGECALARRGYRH